jgi:hypothetical protein
MIIYVFSSPTHQSTSTTKPRRSTAKKKKKKIARQNKIKPVLWHHRPKTYPIAIYIYVQRKKGREKKREENVDDHQQRRERASAFVFLGRINHRKRDGPRAK